MLIRSKAERQGRNKRDRAKFPELADKEQGRETRSRMNKSPELADMMKTKKQVREKRDRAKFPELADKEQGRETRSKNKSLRAC